MKSYIISYDLIKGGDYDALTSEIKEISQVASWHCLESVWIINSNLSAAEINKKLIAKLDEDDKIIVSQIHGPNTSWTTTFSKECRNWLKTNLWSVEL
jgi:hypothetical protein